MSLGTLVLAACHKDIAASTKNAKSNTILRLCNNIFGCSQSWKLSEKRLRYAKWKEEVDWKSVATGFMEGWTLSRVWNSIIVLKQYDNIDRERNNRQPTSKEELWKFVQEAWGAIPEDYLKKWQESLSKKVQAMLKNKGAYAKYWHFRIWTDSVFVLYTVFPLVFAHVSINCCTISCFPAKI